MTHDGPDYGLTCSAMADEELLSLASESGHLTGAAQAELQEELSRRELRSDVRRESKLAAGRCAKPDLLDVKIDETPKGLLRELRSSVLKKRVGQIALAVVLAEAIWRLIRGLTWYLIIPILGKFLHGQTESVLFETATNSPIHWEMLSGALLEFILVVIVVLYLNRWIHREPSDPKGDNRVACDQSEKLTFRG